MDDHKDRPYGRRRFTGVLPFFVSFVAKGFVLLRTSNLATPSARSFSLLLLLGIWCTKLRGTYSILQAYVAFPAFS
jgi:hypothetical protein